MRFLYEDATRKIIGCGAVIAFTGHSIAETDDLPWGLDFEMYEIDESFTVVPKTSEEVSDILQNRTDSGHKEQIKADIEANASRDIWLFRMILAIWDVGVAKNGWAPGDMPEAIKDKAIEWKQKIEEIYG